MISTVMANANAAALPMARSRQPEHAATSASPSKAAEFAAQIARQEKTQASQAEARKQSEISDQTEKSDTLDTPDIPTDGMAGGMLVPIPAPIPVPAPVPPSPPQLKEDDIAVAVEPSPIPGNGENTIPAIQERPSNTGLRTINDEQPNVTNVSIDASATASKSLAPISGQSDGNHQSGMIGNTISTSQINTGPTPPPLSGAIGDMQALVSEFASSVNHFERAGNQWVGNAKIVFQSTVLSGTSVQITGDGKSLNIVLAQSALSSTMASLHYQEKQLCDALTRRLGRTVTLHIEQTLDLDTQAADDAEPQ
jgi:hypothetical protein